MKKKTVMEDLPKLGYTFCIVLGNKNKIKGAERKLLPTIQLVTKLKK